MRQINIKNLSTILALVATIVFWASAYVGIRVGLKGYSPGALALLRYVTASVCMLFLYLIRKKRHKKSLKDIFVMLLIGVFGFGVYSVALNYGEQTVPAGIASFVIALVPVMMTLFAIIFLKEKPSKMAWFGVLVSFLGMVIIAIGESEGVAFDYGVIYLVISVLAAAIYSVAQKPYVQKYRPVEVVAIAIWGGTFSMLIFAPQLLQQIQHAPAKATFAAVYMGIFPGALGFVCWGYVLSKMSAAKAASFLYYLPFVTTLMGWALLGEVPILLSFVGGVVALLGAVITNKSRVKTLGSLDS